MKIKLIHISAMFAIGGIFYRLSKGQTVEESLNPVSMITDDSRTKGLKLVRELEGLASKLPNRLSYFLFPSLASDASPIYAYKDIKGVPTIGYGTTHYPGGQPVNINDVRTVAQCVEYLQNEYDLKQNEIKSKAYYPISSSSLAALTSFTYNIGRTAFFDSTMWKLIQGNADKNIVAAEFDRWVKDDGEVIQGLVNRRKKEKALYLS